MNLDVREVDEPLRLGPESELEPGHGTEAEDKAKGAGPAPAEGTADEVAAAATPVPVVPVLPTIANGDQVQINDDGAFVPQLLTQEERRLQVCLFLSRRITIFGDLEKGAVSSATRAFGITVTGVRRIWELNKRALLHPEKYKLDVSRREGSGAKKKFELSNDEVQSLIAQLKGRSLRSVSAETGIPKSTLYRIVTEEKNNSKGSGKETAKGKAAIQAMQKRMKEYYEGEMAKAVEDATRKVHIENDARIHAMREENISQIEKLRVDLKLQFQKEKDKAQDRMRQLSEKDVLKEYYDGEKAKAVDEARTKVMMEHDIEMDVMKEYEDRERAKAVEEAEKSLKQKHTLEMAKLRERLRRQFEQEKAERPQFMVYTHGGSRGQAIPREKTIQVVGQKHKERSVAGRVSGGNVEAKAMRKKQRASSSSVDRAQRKDFGGETRSGVRSPDTGCREKKRDPRGRKRKHKFSVDEVRAMRREVEGGKSVRDLAVNMGIPRSTMYRILAYEQDSAEESIDVIAAPSGEDGALEGTTDIALGDKGVSMMVIDSLIEVKGALGGELHGKSEEDSWRELERAAGNKSDCQGKEKSRALELDPQEKEKTTAVE